MPYKCNFVSPILIVQSDRTFIYLQAATIIFNVQIFGRNRTDPLKWNGIIELPENVMTVRFAG
jgi:hypothetical protein